MNIPNVKKILGPIPIPLSDYELFIKKRRIVSNGLMDETLAKLHETPFSFDTFFLTQKHSQASLKGKTMQNNKATPGTAGRLVRHSLGDGGSGFKQFLVVYGIFVFLNIFAEEATRTPLERASLIITTAEYAINHEDYAKARNLLFEVISWHFEDTPTLFYLGINLIKIGEFQTAVAMFKRILQRDPRNTSALYNAGFALKNDGCLDEAISYYQKVLAIDPNNDAAHLALGYAYLYKGDFANGWPQHDRYLKKSGKYAPELRTLLESDSLAGKRILLTPEGGLGDTINFISCAQLLKDRGAYLIALVQKPLGKVLSRCTFLDEVITHAPASILYDARVTYMSLPAALRLDETTIPKINPYVFADPTLIAWWHEQLANDTNFKIGICWEADVHNDESRLPVARRSIPLELLAQLGAIPGVSLYSLQTYEHNTACHTPTIDGLVHTFTFPIDTDHGAFMDTAALIANMNLIVTVDTAIAHLAGALGAKVWLLHPYATDWRWIAHRTDSPWHPTMHIFKQPKPFDWPSIMNSVSAQLKKDLAPNDLARSN